ncbi:resolvase, partial [Clostridium perfringens]
EITGVKAMELMNLKKNSFYNLIKKYEIGKERLKL